MIENRSVGEQILSGVFTAFWLISRPFVWIWKFILLVLIETKSVAIKIIGWLIATTIIGSILQYFFHFPLK